MNETDKIKEGMTLIEVKEHCRPLEKPMVEETSKKVRKIITELYQKKHIDEMTFKWLSQTPNPPRNPVFYTLTKTRKVNLSSRPIISGCDSPTERISAFVDSLLQPIMKEQHSYIKDTTQFINFIDWRNESSTKCNPCLNGSLRADEIKLWLTPSAKQRRNPCSGLPAVYPDLSTRHDWPVKKAFVLFVVIANQVEGEFETHFR